MNSQNPLEFIADYFRDAVRAQSEGSLGRQVPENLPVVMLICFPCSPLIRINSKNGPLTNCIFGKSLWSIHNFGFGLTKLGLLSLTVIFESCSIYGVPGWEGSHWTRIHMLARGNVLRLSFQSPEPTSLDC